MFELYETSEVNPMEEKQCAGTALYSRWSTRKSRKTSMRYKVTYSYFQILHVTCSFFHTSLTMENFFIFCVPSFFTRLALSQISSHQLTCLRLNLSKLWVPARFVEPQFTSSSVWLELLKF